MLVNLVTLCGQVSANQSASVSQQHRLASFKSFIRSDSFRFIYSDPHPVLEVQ